MGRAILNTPFHTNFFNPEWAFSNAFIFKTSSSGEYDSVLRQKYSVAQRKVGVPQISFDLQPNMHNRIFKTTNIMLLLPLISLKFMKIPKFDYLNFNETS